MKSYVPEHMSEAENGAELAENRRERSGALSGQNLPLKVRSTIKSLKVKSSNMHKMCI